LNLPFVPTRVEQLCSRLLGTEEVLGIALVAVLALVACLGVAAVRGSRRPVQLRVGEVVQLAGTRVFCRGEDVKQPGLGAAIECFETLDGWRGSYEVGISEHFVWLERHSDARHVNVLFSRQQHR